MIKKKAKLNSVYIFMAKTHQFDNTESINENKACLKTFIISYDFYGNIILLFKTKCLAIFLKSIF